MSVQLLQDAVSPGRSPADAILPRVRKFALGACLDKVALWIFRSGERRALRELVDDKRLLNDIGRTREQALREADKPFWRR